MLQEDSNGETTFEIIDNKAEGLPSSADKTESLSSISSASLPSPGVLLSSVPVTTGNLLSNVAPPSALPSFIPAAVPPLSSPLIAVTTSSAMPQSNPTPPTLIPAAATEAPLTPVASTETKTNISFYPKPFSPAIPPSKGVQYGMMPEKVPPASDDSGGLIGWVRGAVSTGGILSRVAERAKNSVDSMITTLDPQMREYIYSGGDLDIVVASVQEIKISPVREAFQSIFGKATVTGIVAQASKIAAQPVGFAFGIKAAEERIQAVYQNPNVHPVPVVAIENFLVEIEDKWYELGVLILSDPAHNISLQTFTQMTPVPSALVTLAQEDTPSNYALRQSGYSVTIGSLMAKNLGVSHTEWHHALTGVSRRDMILLAAKTLASLYKSSLVQG